MTDLVRFSTLLHFMPYSKICLPKPGVFSAALIEVLKMQFSGCRCRGGQQSDRDIAVDEKKGPLGVDMLVLQHLMSVHEEIIARKEMKLPGKKWV